MRYLDVSELVIAAVSGLVVFLAILLIGHDWVEAIIVGLLLAAVNLGVTYAVHRRRGGTGMSSRGR